MELVIIPSNICNLHCLLCPTGQGRDDRELQAIFNDMVPGISNHASVLGLLLQKDGDLFVRKVKSYIKKVQKGGVIIDVGCGTGSLLDAINHYVPNSYHVIGIDISAESVKLAKQKMRRPTL